MCLSVGWTAICTQNTGIARKGVGGLPLARIFWRICPQCTVGPPKWSFITKKWWIPPQKCALIPQNISFNHISLTFLLTKIIYALLSKNVARYMRFYGPYSPGCREWGGVNLISAMPGFRVHMVPQPLPYRLSSLYLSIRVLVSGSFTSTKGTWAQQ